MESTTMSTVLVGILDQKIQDPHAVSWDINKIGGLPAWISTVSSPSIPDCKNCGQTSSLISQIYCPLGGSEYHRCIYLFACPGDCSKQQNGWRVFRSMKHDSSYKPETDQAKEPKQQPSNILNEVWSQDQDDWGNDSNEWGEEAHEWDEGSQVLQPYEESTQEPAESGMACSEALEATKPEIVYPASGVPDSNNCLLQSIESLSELVLSDDVHRHGCPADITVQPRLCAIFEVQCNNRSKIPVNNLGAASSVLHAYVPASNDGCQDTEEPAVEDVIALADAERWNAMAKLLNTKLEQDCTPGKAQSKGTVVFESYFLSVVEEPAAIVESSDHVNHLIRNYERSEGKQLHMMISDRPTSSKGKEGSSELYERVELKHGDRIFYKFMKRLQLCPQQCIRYDRGGDPLLVSHLQDQPVSRCPHCGRRRIFEFQLLPPLIPYLKTVDGTPCEVEFGTVLVYTCEQNCWPADHDPASELDLLEESIVLQGDPDIHLYR